MSGFSTVNLLFSFLLKLYSLEENHCAKLTLKKWEIIPNIWDFSTKEICLFSVFINLFNRCCYPCGLRCLFYTLDCGPILLHFISQNVSALDTESSFSWFLCHFDIAPSVCIFILFLKYIISVHSMISFLEN